MDTHWTYQVFLTSQSIVIKLIFGTSRAIRHQFLMIFQEYPMIRFCCLEYNDEVISDTVSMKLIELNIDPTKPFWYQFGRQLE